MTTEIKIISDNSLLHACLYNDMGDNPVVSILTGDSAKGLASPTWEPLINELISQNYCVYAFDFFSQGKSEGKRTELSLSKGIANFNDAMSTLENKLGLSKRKLVVIASSFGGAVLLNSPFIFSKLDGIVLKSPASILFEAYEAENDIRQWQHDGISKTSGLSYSAYLDSIKYNSFLNIDKIKCPTLIVHGTHDTIVFPEQSKRLKTILGDKCTLLMLQNVKHDYKQENAMEIFKQEVINFLSNIF